MLGKQRDQMYFLTSTVDVIFLGCMGLTNSVFFSRRVAPRCRGFAAKTRQFSLKN